MQAIANAAIWKLDRAYDKIVTGAVVALEYEATRFIGKHIGS